MQVAVRERAISIHGQLGVLHGQLTTTGSDHGLVIVARDPAAEQFDAVLSRALGARGIAALVLDPLTSEERLDSALASLRRCDIPVLASRLMAAADWLEHVSDTEELPIGCFGTDLRSAAVLACAAQRPAVVSAVVVCDGRPLLAAPALPQLRAPTLSIVSAANDALVRVNRAGLARLLCEKRLECLPGGPQLVADAAVRERVTHVAVDWFERHLRLLT